MNKQIYIQMWQKISNTLLGSAKMQREPTCPVSFVHKEQLLSYMTGRIDTCKELKAGSMACHNTSTVP